MPLSKHDRTIINLSLQILGQAVDRAGKEKVDTVPVRLALRCLLPHCPERWPLENFWDAAPGDNEIGRSQGTTAAYNGIVLQLKAAGRFPG